jgi:hypothetical protein
MQKQDSSLALMSQILIFGEMNYPERLTLSNPCPMTLARVTQGDEDYHCSACSKSLVDFSQMSLSEIKSYLNVNQTACGIFTSDQITVPPKSFLYKFRYLFLTLIAIFGFNVKPILAQTDNVQKDSSSNMECYEDDSAVKFEAKENQNTKKESRKSKRWNRRHPKYIRLMGCPDF